MCADTGHEQLLRAWGYLFLVAECHFGCEFKSRFLTSFGMTVVGGFPYSPDTQVDSEDFSLEMEFWEGGTWGRIPRPSLPGVLRINLPLIIITRLPGHYGVNRPWCFHGIAKTASSGRLTNRLTIES
jgi:hypothetical protein